MKNRISITRPWLPSLSKNASVRTHGGRPPEGRAWFEYEPDRTLPSDLLKGDLAGLPAVRVSLIRERELWETTMPSKTPKAKESTDQKYLITWNTDNGHPTTDVPEVSLHLEVVDLIASLVIDDLTTRGVEK